MSWAEQVAAMTIAVDEQLTAAEIANANDQPDVVTACLRAARAALAAVSCGVEDALPDLPDPSRPPTDDPTTCGHPADHQHGLPGNTTMCMSCGAQMGPDRVWSVT